MRTRHVAVLLSSLLLALGTGCATYQQELQRAEEHFTHDEHEKSLATLRALEPDWTTLDVRDRARYCYLRGMTDYRIGFKADARHWLALAYQIDADSPGALASSEKSLVNEKLGELNLIIWSGDVIPTEEPPGKRAPKKVETTKGDDGDKSDVGDGKKKPGDEDKPDKKSKKTDE